MYLLRALVRAVHSTRECLQFSGCSPHRGHVGSTANLLNLTLYACRIYVLVAGPHLEMLCGHQYDCDPQSAISGVAGRTCTFPN